MATKFREKPLSNLRKYLSIDELHQKKNGDVGKVLLTGVYGWMAWTAGSGVPRVRHRLDKIGSCFEMLEMLAGFNGPAKKHIFPSPSFHLSFSFPPIFILLELFFSFLRIFWFLLIQDCFRLLEDPQVRRQFKLRLRTAVPQLLHLTLLKVATGF